MAAGRTASILALLLFEVGITSQAQILPGVLNAQPGNGVITLGNTAAGSTYLPGYQSAAILPILMYGGTSGYTLSSFTISVSSTNPVNLGIYSAGLSNCPTGASFCAGTLLCSYNNVTPTAGSNTYNSSNFSDCGVFSANRFYYLVVHSTGSSITMNAKSESFCSGTGYFGFHAAIGSGTLPLTMGPQDEPTANQCITASAKFNCVSSCGVAPIPWAVFTYGGNTSGSAVTTANLPKGAYCINGTFGGSLTASTRYTNTPTQALANTPICNGSSVPSGTLSIARSVSSSDYWTYINAGARSGSDTTVLLGWIYNSGNTQDAGSSFDLAELIGGNTITFSSYGGTGLGYCSGSASPPCFKIERTGGTGGTNTWGDIPFSQNSWYALVWHVNNVAGYYEAAVYDTSGVALTNYLDNCAGSTNTICIPNTGTGGAVAFKVMNNGSGVGVAAGDWYYGPFLLDPLGTTFNSIGGAHSQVFFPDGPSVVKNPVLWAMVNSGLIPRAEIKTVAGHSGWWSYALNKFVN